MSRLTKDLKTPHDDTTYSDVVVNAVDREDIVLTKLKHFENLEEELGCPLDVVFKALKEGVRYFDGKTYTTTSKVNYECLLLDIELKAFRVMTEPMPYSNDTWREYDTLYLKDYGKTWWLKGDK